MHTVCMKLHALVQPCTLMCSVRHRSLQWNLHHTDTIGTLPNCPYYRGVLSSEVVQATHPNQRGSPASLKILRQQKKAQRRPGRE